MNYSAKLHLLTKKFTEAYPHSKFPEILHKPGRTYTCLLIDMHFDFLICVPFRSKISHKNAFLFTATLRSRKSKSGLDYSKIIIIKDRSYIDSSTPALVDNDEYAEMMRQMDIIVEEAMDYVDAYINHVTGKSRIHHRMYNKKYGFSTLPYFHDVMGI